MIIVGIMFFTLGAEMSMTPMGERVGSMLTRSQNLFLIIGVGFLLGFLITISEPDLQVLANQVPSIPNMTLILSVAAGVGIFLVMAFLRMLLGIPLPRLLVIFYAAIFLLAAFVPKEFLAVAFDSGSGRPMAFIGSRPSVPTAITSASRGPLLRRSHPRRPLILGPFIVIPKWATRWASATYLKMPLPCCPSS